MYKDIRSFLINGGFDKLSKEEKIKILHKYFPIGLVVNLKGSMNIQFMNRDIHESKIVGYTDDIYDEEDDINYMLLILEDDITDGSSNIDGTLHPIHIKYNENEFRDFKINNLLKQ